MNRSAEAAPAPRGPTGTLHMMHACNLAWLASTTLCQSFTKAARNVYCVGRLFILSVNTHQQRGQSFNQDDFSLLARAPPHRSGAKASSAKALYLSAFMNCCGLFSKSPQAVQGPLPFSLQDQLTARCVRVRCAHRDPALTVRPRVLRNQSCGPEPVPLAGVIKPQSAVVSVFWQPVQLPAPSISLLVLHLVFGVSVFPT